MERNLPTIRQLARLWRLIFSLQNLIILGSEALIAAANRENLNGLIRQFIPKKTDFSQISDDFIQEIEDKINRRHRKRFGYENPQEKLKNLFSQNLHLLLESAKA